ncbi:MAG: hypothetical protein KGI68_03645 [Alphaproteobacteria bacterium]|nr:hypothetical protein [Alphaproteobacteria bacterium]MDE2161686.1 hypothetical protein [Alphaproteobacteria bacterium]
MFLNLSKRAFATAVLTILLLARSAFADVSDFLGNWVNADNSANDIARVVVTRTGADGVNVQVFGRCHPTDCDWGVRPGLAYSEAADSSDVRIVTADFNPSFAREHIALRPAPGGALTFEVMTEFTDHSGRNDYATNGRLTPAPPPPVALQAAPVMPGVSTPTPKPESFIDKLGAAVGLDSTPSTASARVADAPGENCHVYNPVNGFVTRKDGGWNFVDFGFTLAKFGGDHASAIRASQIIASYHFDEQCVDSRYHPQMMYWKSGGVIPRDSLPGQDCIAVDPKAVLVASKGNGWRVVDGTKTLFEYADDKSSAELTASVIRTYRLNRECFVGGHDGPMRYWLSQ